MMLNFHEGGGGYQETVKIGKNSVEFDVPYHNGIEETKYLNDYEAVSIIILSDNIINTKQFSDVMNDLLNILGNLMLIMGYFKIIL